MGELKRVSQIGRRFLFDRQYRNRVLDLIQRQTDHQTSSGGAACLEATRELKFLRKKRLFVVAGCELTFLVEHLQNAGMKVSHSAANGRGADPMTELLTPGSHALSESWDYYILSVAQIFRRLIRRMQMDGIHYHEEEQRRDLAEVLDNYRQAVLAIRKRSGAPIFLFSYVLTYIPALGFHEYRSMKKGWSLIEFLHVFHLQLYELARELSATYILDVDLALQANGKISAVNWETSSGMFDHLSPEGAGRLADHFVRHISIIEPTQRHIKCAVFDLDGTLWGGVLREDGPAGVIVREYYLNTMEILASRGIALGICSKNDPVEITHLPGLIGQELYAKIVTCHLGWRAKSQVLREIADELNLGLDSLAFFDDSPIERAEVAASAPEVMVLSPDQIFECPNLPAFQQAGESTSESVTRTTKYMQAAKRREAEKAADKLEEFLFSCELKLNITPASASDLSRIFELLSRTNQLNATLARTSMDQLKEQLENPSTYHLLTARLQDRFGEYGLIGFTSARKAPGDWNLIELAFSCRAATRGVEQAMLGRIAADAYAAKAGSLCISCCRGPRNQEMLRILQECGFSCSNAPPDDEAPIRLCLFLSRSNLIEAPEWLRLATHHDALA